MALCGDGVMKQCCYNVMFRRVANGADKVEVEPQGAQISHNGSRSGLFVADPGRISGIVLIS